MYRSLLVWLGLCSPLLFLCSGLAPFVLVAGGGVLAAFLALILLRSSGPAPRELAENFRNIVIAHRGGQRSRNCAGGAAEERGPVFPENTLAAFRWASSPACGGADAFELDIWLSKDGVPVVNHDADVFRHWDSAGLVGSKTLAELKAMRPLAKPILPPPVDQMLHPTVKTVMPSTNSNGAGVDGDDGPQSSPDSADYAYEKTAVKHGHTEIDARYLESERMPTLVEVLDMLEKEAPHMKLMIEVKEIKRASLLCRTLAAMFRARPWMYSRCFVAAFNPFLLWRLRREDSRIVTSCLFIDRWTSHLQRNARDNRITIPWWLRYNYPLLWLVDDLVWWLGTNPRGLRFLGASLSACEVKALSSAQIRRDRAAGIITSTWCANQQLQKEWLLHQGVTVITDTQFGGGTSAMNPRTLLF